MFVVEQGSLEVIIDDEVCNTVNTGKNTQFYFEVMIDVPILRR